MYPITSSRSPNRKIWRLVSASKLSIAVAEAPSGISLSNSKKRAEFSLRAAVSITVTAACSRRARSAARTCKPVKTSAPINVTVETRLSALAKSRCIKSCLAHEQIKLAHIQTDVAIVLPSQLEKSESILVGGKATIHRFVQVDEAASNHEQSNHRLWRVLGDHQRVGLDGRFVDVCSGLRDPVMLQISPVTAHCIAMNGAHVVVSSHHRTEETFQNDDESSRCDVKAAGLEPDTIRVRHPQTLIFQVDVSNEVFATSSIRIETVGKIAEGSDRHKAMIAGQRSAVGCQESRCQPR